VEQCPRHGAAGDELHLHDADRAPALGAAATQLEIIRHGDATTDRAARFGRRRACPATVRDLIALSLFGATTTTG